MILDLCLAVVLAIVLIEVASRLPFAGAVASIRRTSKKTVLMVRAKSVSDHWKEKAMLAYAGQMLKNSLWLGGLLLLLGVLATLLVLGFAQLSAGFDEFIMALSGLVATIVAAAVYIPIRRRLFR